MSFTSTQDNPKCWDSGETETLGEAFIVEMHVST